MVNNVIKKGFIIGIIVLFIGASVGVCDFDKTKLTLTISKGLNNTTISTCNCEKNKQVIINGKASTSRGLTSDDITALQKQCEIHGWTYTVGENPATKYSIDELCGLVVPKNWRVGAKFDPSMPIDTLPSSFDWRDVAGGLPPIKDQDGCGSCWAFGTVAPLECNIKIKDGVTVDLSEQWLLSCNTDGYSCNGGWWCHEYFKENGAKKDPCGGSGAVLEQYFPYVSYDAPCNCPYPHDYFINDWAYIGPPDGVATVDEIKQAIYEYGPVSVALCVNSAFQAYSGGIFNGPTCDNIDHAVALVGWDDNQGTNGVWFLRNSWGTGWGEGGYMRIEYGVCDVGYAAVRIDYHGYQNYPPNIPSSPSPPNHATSVSPNADLSWTGGDPNYNDTVTYDVYFGISNPPTKVSSNQSDTSYDPGTMNYDTHYYWKIVTWDNHGSSTVGPIWDFTTWSQPDDPPYTPSNPSPPNGTINCDFNINLSWTGGDPDPADTVFYDVYLEANNSNATTKVSNHKNETSFNTGPLEPDTIYYWKIYAIDNHDAVTKGPIWHFTTKQAPVNHPPGTPTIKGPLKGKPGTSYEYTFTAIDPDGDQIYYYIDWGDGSNSGWQGPYASPYKGSHSWTEKTTFTIKCKAKDMYGLESDWGTLGVAIPRNNITIDTLFQRFLQNHPNLFPILQKLLNRLGQ